jgi:hypothetical protein
MEASITQNTYTSLSTPADEKEKQKRQKKQLEETKGDRTRGLLVDLIASLIQCALHFGFGSQG